MEPAVTNSDWSSLRYRNRQTTALRLRLLLWETVRLLLFRPSPRWAFNGWRRGLLRAFGARIGRGAIVRPSCRVWGPWNLAMEDFSCLGDRVDCYCVAPIRIGAKAAISQDTFLCTASHEVRTLTRELTTAPIEIGPHAWIAARAFVGPGVTVGEGAVIGACAVVTRSVEPWMIAVGNPARAIKRRELLQPAAASGLPAGGAPCTPS